MATDPSNRSKASPSKSRLRLDGTVTYGQIVWTLIVFSTGAVVTLLIQNALGTEKFTFGTVDLLNFMFGVSLAGASTLLAVVAIGLAKSGEQTMIDRSDKSIQLQNQVFQQTIGALSSIQTSTGTTEKRIEDIIAGRTALQNLAQNAAVRVVETYEGSDQPAPDTGVVAHAIEQSLDSILNEMKDPNGRPDAEESLARFIRTTGMNISDKFTDEIKNALLADPNALVERFPLGIAIARDENVFDAIVRVVDMRVGIGTINTSAPFGPGELSRFLRTVHDLLGRHIIERAIIVIDAPLKNNPEMLNTFHTELVTKTQRIYIVDGPAENAVGRLHRIVKDIADEQASNRPTQSGALQQDEAMPPVIHES